MKLKLIRSATVQPEKFRRKSKKSIAPLSHSQSPRLYLTMGLAEPKRKKRLAPSHNAHSTWSKSTAESSLGFKLMSSMGWAPGHGLGQDLQGEKDNVKYSLKDDVLGVGAKKEYGGGLWRGTSEIDDLYKRLEVGAKAGVAGEKVVEKVEEVVEEKVKMRGGWAMRFQVGDTYTSSFSRNVSETEVSTPAEGTVEEAEVKEKKSKKRKREGEKEEKKKKKSRKIKEDGEAETDASATAEPELPPVEEVIPVEEEPKKDKGKKDKSKKELKENKKSKKQPKEETTTADEDAIEAVEGKKEKRKDKKSKKDQEDKRTEDKADKPTPKKEKETSSKKDKNGSSKKRKDKATSDTAASSAPSANPSTHEATPVSDSDGPSKSSRHMHRARFMAMKKASVLNPDALREILGVSA
jgi:G-patch domain